MEYEVFGAKMTIDTSSEALAGYSVACKSCQCNCQQCFACRNMRLDGIGDEPLEAEKALESFLKEAA